jgi:hypothetical protein
VATIFLPPANCQHRTVSAYAFAISTHNGNAALVTQAMIGIAVA